MATLTTHNPKPAETVADLLAEDGVREMNYRESDGLRVWLLWDDTHNEVLVALTDAKTGEDVAFGISPGYANDAFRHPFCYLANR